MDKELEGFPELVDYFNSYVDGTAPLPLKETFKKVGYDYDATRNTIRGMNKLNDKQDALRNIWLHHR